jgi:hypothetical protein
LLVFTPHNTTEHRPRFAGFLPSKYNTLLGASYPSLDQWMAVATPFITDQDLQNAYVSVEQFLAQANLQRQNIDTFLSSLNAWNATNNQLIANRPDHIAELLVTGLETRNPNIPPVQQYGWLKTLIGTIVNIAAGAVGVFGGGPPGALATSFLLNAIANPIDAYLDGDFDDKPPPSPPSTDTTGGVQDAADQMQTFTTSTFVDTFALLASPAFESGRFSNYGLIQAMEHVRFSPTAFDAPTASQAFLENYDRSVWEKLLPRMFSWKEMQYAGSSDSLTNFTFFVPLSETAQYLVQGPNNPFGQPTYYYENGSWSLGGGKQEMINTAKNQLLQLQYGKPFSYGGHDFTPSGETGPGQISGPQTLEGHSGSFYTITSDSHIDQSPLYRHEPYNGYGRTYASLDGSTLHEWALVTSDDKTLSQAAADALFGTGSLELTNEEPLYYPNKGTSSYTYDLRVQSGGLVTRFDVFSNWGQDVQGFSPRSFQPGDPGGYSYMSALPLNSNSQVLFDNMYAYYTLSYGSGVSTVPDFGGTEPPPPSGRGRAIDQFLITLYQEQRGRAPELQGLRFWAKWLAKGMQPGRVARALWASAERQALVNSRNAPPISFADSLIDAKRAAHRILRRRFAIQRTATPR